MEVYTDLVNDEEYFTSASPFISVEDEEGKIDALIGIQAKTISDPDMDSDDETAEKNLDHLWHFPSINKEPVEFKKFKEFKTEYFKGYAKGLLSLKKERGDFKDDDDEKEFQQSLGRVMNWIKANFKEMTFYCSVVPTTEKTIKGKKKDLFASYAYAYYPPGAAEPVVCFLKAGYKKEKF